jgi:hypothetical protein
MGIYFLSYNFFQLLLVFYVVIVGKISHFKNTPCISYFIKRTPTQFPCLKAYFL